MLFLFPLETAMQHLLTVWLNEWDLSHSHMMDNHFIAHNRTVVFSLFSLEDPTVEYIKCYALLRSESPVLRRAFNRLIRQ